MLDLATTSTVARTLIQEHMEPRGRDREGRQRPFVVPDHPDELWVASFGGTDLWRIKPR